MIRHFTTLSLLALVVSCTTQSEPPPKPAFDSSRNPNLLTPDLYPSGGVPEKEPVVRYGRYTLVSTLPASGQRDLMAQIIDISIPANMNPNVRDAMQYTMNRSGYSLCSPDTGHVNILYTRPLPAAQYKLGPMTLRNTLQVLAGPAWQVKVDEVTRQVCYVLRSGYQLPVTPKPVSTPVVQQKPSLPTVTKQPASVPTVIKSSTAESPVRSAVIVSAAPTSPGTSTPQAPANPVTLSKDSPSTESKTAVARPVPASPPRAPAPVTRTANWTASVGSTLQQTVTDWCKRAGWQLIWHQQDLDYPIEAALTFEGSFQEAIAQIFPLYDNAPRRFTVDGNAAQRVIYVSERKP